MSTGYFVGAGDKTTCGGQVLNGSDSVVMHGLLHAREGDAVSCGKDGKTYQVSGGVSYMSSHGKLVAGTLDSVSTCPCRARFIPSVISATYHSDSTYETAPRVWHAAPPSLPPHAATPNQTISHPDQRSFSTVNSRECKHPDQMADLASYISGEMNQNISHPSVLKMQSLNNFSADDEFKKYNALPYHLKMGHPPQFHSLAIGKKARAFAIWTERVGQNRPWDHKPKLQALFSSVWHKQGAYSYFYDIWSNIHYGYIGIIAGFSESILLDGAGLEQIASDLYRKAEEMVTTEEERWKMPGPHPTADKWTDLRSWDDVADRVSISIGVKLARQYPRGNISGRIIMEEVLAIPPNQWGSGIKAHACV